MIKKKIMWEWVFELLPPHFLTGPKFKTLDENYADQYFLIFVYLYIYIYMGIKVFNISWNWKN